MAIELNGFLAEGINRHDHHGEIRMLTFRCPGGKKHTHSIPTTDASAFRYEKSSPFEDIEVWHREFQNGKLVIMPSIDGSKPIDGTTIVPCGFHDYYIFNLVPKEDVFFG